MHSSGEFIRPAFQTSQLRQLVANDRPAWEQKLVNLDTTVTGLLARHSLTLLRISIGIVFVWFGALKFFPGVSPAEPLIRASITFLPMELFLPFLAIWEVVIGLGFISGRFMRATIILLLMQMGGAMSPIILRPDLIFTAFPYALTLEGQYVIKDIILISAGLVIGATVRGGGLTSEAKKPANQ